MNSGSIAPRRFFFGSLLALAFVSIGILGRTQSLQAAGTISLTALGSAYTQNFNTLASSGTSSTVPTGWDFSESGTNANTTYTAGTGSSNTGDTYSFGVAGTNPVTDRAFGGLQSGSLNPTIGASFTNNTGSTITQLAISYTGEQWRLGQSGRGADRLDFQLSTNATSLTTGNWVDYNNLDFSSPVTTGTVGLLDGNASANRTQVSATITGLNVPNGTVFWIRWSDFNVTGSDDGLAVDDFSLTPSYVPVPTNPSGVGVANPSSVFAGNLTLLTIAVTPGTNPTSTGLAVTGNLTSIGGSATQQFYDDGTNGDVTSGDYTFSFSATVTVATSPGTKTLSISITDAQSRTGSTSINLGVLPAPIAIHTIQGARHFSTYNNQAVTTLPSIVTALRTTGSTRGFYIQDPNPDSDPATSEGIFVFTGSSSNPATLVAVGDQVYVSGTVSEYRGAAASLTLTELVAPYTIIKLSSGNPLPAPIVIGTGGRIPPPMVIEDDASGSVETTGIFDPANDGIDFYEALEGMLVQVNNAVAVGPCSDFTSNREIPIVGDNGVNAGVRTNRDGVIAQSNDFNPERIILNDWISGGPTLPAANVGDKFPGTITGVIDYSFNNFKLQVISIPALVSGGLTQETAATANDNQLSIAAFNVENLAPADPASKFSTLAELIVNHLQSPDVISIEEIQDNSGATNDGTVSASTTWKMLIDAIKAASGITYEYRQIDPVNNQDGGATGGNIRVGFLFRTDRGLSFIDRPGASSTTANAVVGSGANTRLQYSPGRIDPTNAAFNTSRKPLAGEFMFHGHHLFMIANHWNSKGGDEPLFGVNQPPTFSSEVQRIQQATVVRNFVQAILNADPNAYVAVMGDLNDFQFSSALATLKGSPAILTDMINTLPLAERYTYVYEGNSETLDHILVSGALVSKPYVYDVVHVNSEFAAQASDHEPQVMLVKLNAPPSMSANPASPTVQYSDLIDVTIKDEDVASDLPPTSIVTAWKKSGDPSFAPGLPSGWSLSSATCSTTQCTWTLKGKVILAPATYIVRVTATDASGDSGFIEITVTVNQEDARVTYTGALFASTSSATSSTANVTLAATVQDITAVTGDPAYDPDAGNIRNGTLAFVNRDAGNAVLCTAPIGLVNASDSKTGTATCAWSANLGSADSLDVTVGVVIGGYYVRNSSDDDVIVTVSKPLASNFITGGGYLVLTGSAGEKAGAAGSKANFGFNVKFNPSGKNLQGHINVIVRNGGRVYQVKGNMMSSLAVQPTPCENATATAPCTATFNGKANIQDITDPNNAVPVDGNATLQVVMTDKGEPGSSDSIAITVWNKSGGLWFASKWDGTKTVEQTLGGGNLVVH